MNDDAPPRRPRMHAGRARCPMRGHPRAMPHRHRAAAKAPSASGASSLRVPQNQDDAVAPKEHLGDEPVLVHSPGLLLPLPRLRNLSKQGGRRRRQAAHVGSETLNKWKLFGLEKDLHRGQRHKEMLLRASLASVHISLTFSSTMLQCLSNAFTRPSSFLLFLQLMSTCSGHTRVPPIHTVPSITILAYTRAQYAQEPAGRNPKLSQRE